MDVTRTIDVMRTIDITRTMGHENNRYPSTESQWCTGSESSIKDNGEQEQVRNEQVLVM